MNTPAAPAPPPPAPSGSNWRGREWGGVLGGGEGVYGLNKCQGRRRLSKLDKKNRHHTLKPFLFVCMGHACVLGQEPSLETV